MEDVQVSSSLQQYAAYPFALDDTYQQGLASILAGGVLNGDATAEVKDEILRRTRVFYFNKTTGNDLSMDEARAYELSLQGAQLHASEADTASELATSQNLTTSEEEPRVLTFAELKELIESGKTDQIPNNKIIPEKFSEEAPSQSTAQVRRKPWEAAVPVEESS
ncbi:hypothetical protein FA15DRAFT_590471 [Coprinopsis marcescibilis]|uniref:Uncharacterized protein n=1 Tax=Coprinopsis marcescibilis TaxID=230819 RepID=A0A5C3KY93_COPMA|nr:hypothetical protein FA15DRAFT_590471 [Coprinopsis marcescibilis]